MSIPEFSSENHYSVVDRRGMLEHLMRKYKQSDDCLEAYGPRQRPFIPKFQPPLYALTALRKKQLTIRNLKTVTRITLSATRTHPLRETNPWSVKRSQFLMARRTEKIGLSHKFYSLGVIHPHYLRPALLTASTPFCKPLWKKASRGFPIVRVSNRNDCITPQ